MCTIFKWWFAQLTPYYITILLQALLSHDSHHCIFGVLELQLGLQREVEGDVQRRTSENSSKRKIALSNMIKHLETVLDMVKGNVIHSNEFTLLDFDLFTHDM